VLQTYKTAPDTTKTPTATATYGCDLIARRRVFPTFLTPVTVSLETLKNVDAIVESDSKMGMLATNARIASSAGELMRDLEWFAIREVA